MLYLFSKAQRERLSKPFGPVMRRMPEELGKSRIISVGDIVTLGLIRGGITPFLAVFDFRTRRRKLDAGRREELEMSFSSFHIASNPPGFLSDSAIGVAKRAMREGGALVIDGEEDLTLLGLMRFARKRDIFMYGMPDSGFCLIGGERGKIISRSFIGRAKRVPPSCA